MVKQVKLGDLILAELTDNNILYLNLEFLFSISIESVISVTRPTLLGFTKINHLSKVFIYKGDTEVDSKIFKEINSSNEDNVNYNEGEMKQKKIQEVLNKINTELDLSDDDKLDIDDNKLKIGSDLLYYCTYNSGGCVDEKWSIVKLKEEIKFFTLPNILILLGIISIIIVIIILLSKTKQKYNYDYESDNIHDLDLLY